MSTVLRDLRCFETPEWESKRNPQKQIASLDHSILTVIGVCKLCAFPILAVAGFLISGPVFSQSVQNGVGNPLVQQKAVIQNEWAGHQRAIQQAENALHAGQQALSDAQSQDNAQAESISQQAINIAQHTLNNAQQMAAIDQQRLAALNRALTWKNPGKAFGIPAIMHGTVQVKSGRGLIPLDANAAIEPGQEVVTGKDSSLEIITESGARIQVGPNSGFVYLSDKNSISQLLSGLVHVMEEPVSGLREMNIYTQYASSAVRGTEYEVTADHGTDGFYLLKGSMEVRLRKGHKSVLLQSGQMITVGRHGFIGVPQSISAATLPTR